MKPAGSSQLTGAALAVVLMVVLVQAYLFETVLEAVLDGQRRQLPGALVVSALLSAVALFLAFRVQHGSRIPAGDTEKASTLDRRD